MQDKPFLALGSRVVDADTGEILLDLSLPGYTLEDYKRVRSQIDWEASISRFPDLPRLQIVSALLAVYARLYPDYPDFVPGFVNPAKRVAPAGDEDADAADRGLSNSNKVQSVVLRNSITGKLITLDKREARLSRMRRRVFSWANTIKDYLPAYGKGRQHRKVMITLTYRGVDDWRPNHIRDYIKELKRRLGDKLIAIAWVAELQERGAVHYHVELVCLKGTRIPKPDESGMWTHGMSRIETAKTVFYICAYLKKAYQKLGKFPKGLRMFSVWVADGSVSTVARWLFKLSSLPAWFAKILQSDKDHWGGAWARMPGGGFRYNGRFFRSPFQFVGFA